MDCEEIGWWMEQVNEYIRINNETATEGTN